MLDWVVWERTIFIFNSLFELDRNKGNHLTVCKQMSPDLIKMVIYKMFRNHCVKKKKKKFG